MLDLLRPDLRRLPRADPPPSVALPELHAHLGRPVRVGVARLDGIGDWVLTLPLVTALLDSPDVGSTTLVAPSAYRSLLDRPTGARFLGLDLRTRLRPGRPGGAVGELLASSGLGQRAAHRDGARHRGELDLLVVPRFDVDRGFHLLAWGTGAGTPLVAHDPRRQRLATPQERAEAAVLAAAVVAEDGPAHEVERLRPLLAALGLPDEPSPAAGARFFGVPAGGDPASRALVVHTGAAQAKRRWPEERWQELLHDLLDGDVDRVLLVGGPEDAAVQSRLAAALGPRVEEHAGRTPLGDLPALMSRAEAFVGSDSGPAHLAASVGLPVVVVSAHPADGLADHGNSPRRFGPWTPRGAVVQPPTALPPCEGWCSADSAHCITAVSAGAVRDALRALVRPGGGAGRA